MKKITKLIALGLICLMFFNATTAYAQNSDVITKCQHTSEKKFKNILISDNKITLNKTPSTISKFGNILVDKTIKVSKNCNMQTSATIAVGVYFIPGIGEIAIATTGAIVVAGVTIAAGTWLYKTITKQLNNSHKREIAKVKASIPTRLRDKNGNVNLGKFKNKVKGKNSYKENDGWTIDKDTAGHGGRKWKLKNKSGKRIASLGSNGEVLGK